MAAATGSIVGWLVGNGAVALAAGWLGRKSWGRSKRIKQAVPTWPTTDGIIAKSQYITTAATENSSAQTYLYVVYDYSVAGKKIRQKKKVYENSLFSELEAKYPVNAPAQIHYDPAKPSRSTFDARVMDEGQLVAILSYFVAILAALFFAVGLYALIFK